MINVKIMPPDNKTPIYCVDCGVETESITSDFSMADGKIVIKDLPAQKCPKCGKVTFDIHTIAEAERLIERQVEVPIPQPKFERKLSFDGKAFVMRIPKQIQEALGIGKNKNKVVLYIKDRNKVIMEF